MKITRSTKCSIKFSTKYKKTQLIFILNEYQSVVNFFIDLFWNNPIEKKDLLKDVVNSNQSWFSHRLKKTAAREAIDMIKTACAANQPKPFHNGKRMCVSSTIAELQQSKTKTFDNWLHLSSIGNKTIIDIPIKLHKHFYKWNNKGERLNYYIITKDYVQFCFKIETGPKKERKQTLGLDSGINSLASLSTGEQLGLNIKEQIEKINKKKYGSKGQKRARKALKQIMDEIAKQLTSDDNIDCIVVEKLSNLNYKSKIKKKSSKGLRKVIGSWVWRYWLTRIQMNCEENRVFFRSVHCYNTSITCNECGHTDKRNRQGDIFLCLNCGHTDNADINAAKNILDLFLTGPYGAGFKPLDQIKIL